MLNDQIKLAASAQRHATRLANKAKAVVIADIMRLAAPYMFKSQFLGSDIALFMSHRGTRARKLGDNTYEGLTADGNVIDDIYVGMAVSPLMDRSFAELMRIKKHVLKRSMWRRYAPDAQGIPTANIEWSDVLPTSTVQLIRNCYVIDGKAVAYWYESERQPVAWRHGREGLKAQRTLNGMVESTALEIARTKRG